MEIQYYRQADTTEEHLPLAARAGDFIFYGGGIAAHPVTGMPPQVRANRGFPNHGADSDRQLRYVYDTMSEILDAAGSSIKQIMKINAFHTYPAGIDAAIRLRREYFNLDSPPPSTLVLAPATPVPDAAVTTDVITLANDAKLGRGSHLKGTEKTPLPAIGLIYGRPVYVQLVRGGGLIFTQGKGASRGGELAAEVFGNPDLPYRDNQIKIQTEIIMDYFIDLLEQEGASLKDVARADIFLNHTRDIAGLDEIWKKYFPTDPPARMIYPAKLATSEDAIVEIELIAVDPQGPYTKKVIHTDAAPTPISHESQAVNIGPYVFLSGLMATDYKQAIAPEAQVNPDFPFHASSAKLQAAYILKNAAAITEAAGTSLQNLVRRRAVYTDLTQMPQAEEAWREVLGNRLPPTTSFQPSDALPVPACSLMYDLIAYIPD